MGRTRSRRARLLGRVQLARPSTATNAGGEQTAHDDRVDRDAEDQCPTTHGRYPGPAPGELKAWTLVQAYPPVARRFHEILASVGLTKHQFGVLVKLTTDPGISQAALARHILITPQSMGEILTQMESASLVRRTGPQRRGTPIAVEITHAGREATRTAYPLIAAINTPAALGLREDEAVTLNRLLHKVVDHLVHPSNV